MPGSTPEDDQRSRIEPYLDRLYGYAVHLAGSPDDARDLVQGCALRALAAADIPEHENAYRSWLFRILRNLWFDECRRRRRHAVSIDAMRTDEGASWNDRWLPDVSNLEKRLFNRLAVREGLARIGDNHREILVLVDMVGFSYQETAELLEVPIGTVMSRVSRARRQLLQALEEPAIRPLRMRLIGRGS